MDDVLKRNVLKVLDENRIMSLATVRPDGWPQANTVGYAHEGLTLYFLCGPDSQKAKNLAGDPRVSLTINRDVDEVLAITGVSMAARAETITEPAEGERVLKLLMAQYPAQTGDLGPMPKASDVRLVRLVPSVISLIDYRKGFGHTDLLEAAAA
jgi:nitroimidazol reductase NimA-like FMN-containing flavoprotein (pyridoxamine 5'-phosphate oxidase superfamily)